MMGIDSATAEREVPRPHRLGDEGTGGGMLNAWSTLRDRASNLHEDVANGHQEARRQRRNSLTTQIALREPRELLDELAQAGLSWAVIAKICGVSPTAVRKWRRGDAITGQNRRRLAGALAFLELASEALSPIEDAAAWLEVPLHDDATLTPADLLAVGHADALLELASGRIGPDALLDDAVPDWRTRHRRDERFVVEPGPDGMPAIRERA